jgi:hypothetical protein
MKASDILNALKSVPAASKLLTPQGITGALELYSSYEQLKAKGPVTTEAALSLAPQGFEYLKAQGITLDDVASIVSAATPLIAAKG